MDSSGTGTIGSTLTSGIQDISALLPLLGTEQCEDHISSGLTKGYLYPAAAPMSIFGTLGTARAGFKTLVASISIPKWDIIGAQTLADAGFGPRGTNLPLIMVDKEDKKQYLAEKELDTLLKELHIENAKDLSVSSRCIKWNIIMVLLTAAFCSLSIAPYIHLNTRGKSSLGRFIRWAFPVTRALGGFLTATMIQIVTQARIVTIAEKRLAIGGIRSELEGLDKAERKHLSFRAAKTALQPGKGEQNEPKRELLDSRNVGSPPKAGQGGQNGPQSWKQSTNVELHLWKIKKRAKLELERLRDGDAAR